MNKLIKILNDNKKGFLCFIVAIIVIVFAYFINLHSGNYYINITKWFYITLFIVAEAVLGIFLIYDACHGKPLKQMHCKIVCMNLISFAYLFCHDKLFLSKEVFCLFAVIFFGTSMTGLFLLWRHKDDILKNHMGAIIISSFIIIINFAGIYDCFYNAYASIAMESFTGKEQNRWLMPEDFVWYSVEVFLGVDVSDVEVSDVFYEEIIADESSLEYMEQWTSAQRVTRILKIAATIEVLIFLLYISIIISGCRDTGRIEKNSGE